MRLPTIPAGVKSGEWAVEQLGGKGKVLILRGAPGVVSDERGGGFISVVEQHPDIEIVMGPYTDFDRAKAYDAAQNMLAAHPDINLIYGMSTTIGLGAAQVVRQMGKSEEILTMGFGGTGDEITAMKEGWLTASVLRPIDDSGVAVADAFVAHSKGEDVPLVWGGSFVMVDRWSDTDDILEYANRYSRPKMGR